MSHLDLVSAMQQGVLPLLLLLCRVRHPPPPPVRHTRRTTQSREAFKELADEHWGVISLKWHETSCDKCVPVNNIDLRPCVCVCVGGCVPAAACILRGHRVCSTGAC
jgi:hypothetical protein